MKVFIVSNTSWYIYNFRLPLIKELLERGIDVFIVAPYDEWVGKLLEFDVRYIDVQMNRKGLNPFTDIILFWRLLKIYRQEKPDFIHHFTIKPVIYGSVAAYFSGIRNVINMVPGRGYVFSGNTLTQRILTSLVKIMYKFALTNSIMNFFQNPEDRNFFINNMLVKSGKTDVTFGSGVDLNHFGYVDPKCRGESCTFILVARMLWDKGVGEFVEAAKVIKSQFKNTHFQLLGRIDNGNPRGIKKSIIEEWDKSGYIEYLEEMLDIRPAVADSDVVALPSYYLEGVPKSLLEAMSMGRPIITTDWPGCRETVVHTKNGLLITPKNVEELIEAIVFMIQNPAERVRMGRTSRKLAVENFDVKRVNKMFLKAMNLQ